MKERIQTHKVSPVGKDVTILSDQKKARPNFVQISYGGKWVMDQISKFRVSLTRISPIWKRA